MRDEGKRSRARYPIILAVFLTVSCATAPTEPARGPITSDAEVNALLGRVEAALSMRDWQRVIDEVDREDYRLRVQEGGIGEPQYLADILGLTRPDNTLQSGRRVTWADLERIQRVRIESAAQEADGRWRFRGEARLTGGGSLQIEGLAVQRDGKYRLTSGVASAS